VAIVCGLLVLVAVPARTRAQVESASVSGRVTDPSNGVVIDAEVEIKNTDTAIVKLVKTNSEGVYLIPALRPGNYLMTVRKTGFQTVTVTGITLNVQDNLSRNFVLKVGSSAESVTVTASDYTLNTTDASVSTVVDRNFVENMPLNGRSLQSLIELSPGVVVAGKIYSDSVGQFSANGQRADANYFSIDGVSANIGVGQGTGALGSGGAGALPATTASGGTNNLVSIDAMQEFKIQTSTYAPEFGRTPGAQVSIVTRSGTNQFHGTAFEYLRNDVLDARDWFTNYLNLPKPAERQNDFGGVFGGPILKNRLFFFFSYEGLRLRLPLNRTEIEPSTALRAEAPANLQPILNAFPKPTSDDGPITGVFSGSFSNPATLNATSIRMDYTVTNKINVFGRYNHAPSNAVGRGAYDYYALSTLGHTLSNVDTITAGSTITLKSNLLDEFRFNYSRVTAGTTVTADNFGGAVVPSDAYLFQSNPSASSTNDSFVALFLPDSHGWYIGKNAEVNPQRQLNFVDTLSWTLGSHSLKFGGDFRRLTPRDGFQPYQMVFFFSGFAQALTDTVGFSEVQTTDVSLRRPDFHNLSFFAQDTWRATPNLTLTYGIRWDFNPPPSESTGRPLYTVTNLGDPANAALAPAGTPIYAATYDNFAPRLGIAYSVRRTPGREMVVRTGFGIFYDLGNNSVPDADSFPYFRDRFLYNVPYPLTAAQAAPVPFTVAPPYGYVSAFDPHLKLPRTYEWNLSIQQSLGPNQSITASYLGAAGRNLLRPEEITSAAGLNTTDFAAGINVTTNGGFSNYDALQLQYQRHLSHGLQVLASYTWAHALDNTSPEYAAPYYTIYNPNIDYSDSVFDVRHSFSSAITYNLPVPGKSNVLRAIVGHWALDSLFRANTAAPVDVLTGLDPFHMNSFLNNYGRPDVVPGQPRYLYGSQYPGGKAINPAAFQDPAATNVQGNLGRNALRGFGAWEEDLAIRREFPIHEQIKLQFRGEMFNIFNHPNFGDPGVQFSLTNQLNNPLFGLSTMTLAQSLYAGGGSGGFSPLYQLGGPRSIQLALKLIF
jgi:hypothetical protein